MKITMNTKQNILVILALAALLIVLLPNMLHAYEEIVVKDGAKIRGTVNVEGKLPRLPPLQITKYKEVCRDVTNEGPDCRPGSGTSVRGGNFRRCRQRQSRREGNRP